MSSHTSKEPFDQDETSGFEDFLTPEQRLEAVAEILSAVTIRVIKKRHDQNQFPRA
jgi:hypothetical protein